MVTIVLEQIGYDVGLDVVSIVLKDRLLRIAMVKIILKQGDIFEQRECAYIDIV